mmetsp:Transcript_10511/g.32676  ORF Transcript_10511/g.32676 Transcript_10511/m.32676 type:complete len:90 (+) Transcript_10511:1740-2009(+)
MPSHANLAGQISWTGLLQPLLITRQSCGRAAHETGAATAKHLDHGEAGTTASRFSTGTVAVRWQLSTEEPRGEPSPGGFSRLQPSLALE